MAEKGTNGGGGRPGEGRRSGRPAGRRRIGAVGLTLGVFLAALLSTLSCESPPAAGPRHVVLIVVDTLRQDHLGGYGSPRSASPNLDALATDGVQFRRAYAPSPWTLPSVVSIHTGLYPGSHGVIDPARELVPEATTLAEILKGAGYRTAAMVSNRILQRPLRLDQGFDVYLESEVGEAGHVSTDGITDQALATLDDFAAGDDPFFLFVHYFDPHSPYERHAVIGYAAESAGRLRGGELIGELRNMMDTMTAEEITFVRDSYDEEVRWTDRGIGRLVDGLRERGLLDETLVIVTADHGEEFLTRGWIGHTRSLYEELVRVPLVVRDPRRSGRRAVVERAVPLVGVTPTVLELLGVGAGEGGAGIAGGAGGAGSAAGGSDAERSGAASPRFQAESFAADVLAPRSEPDAEVFLEVDYTPLDPKNAVRRTYKKGLIADGWKTIRDDSTGVVELYELATDGGEQWDRGNALPELKKRMAERLEDWVLESRAQPLEAGMRRLTPEQLEQLEALGYVGR